MPLLQVQSDQQNVTKEYRTLKEVVEKERLQKEEKETERKVAQKNKEQGQLEIKAVWKEANKSVIKMHAKYWQGKYPLWLPITNIFVST